MDRPKLTEFTFPKTLQDLPFPAAEAGVLLERNAGFRTSKPIIDNDKCVKCMMCYLLCPEGAVYKDGDKLAIDYDFCKGCGICEQECKPKVIKMVPEANRNEQL